MEKDGLGHVAELFELVAEGDRGVEVTARVQESTTG